eukprot:g32934.t1
MHQKPRYLGSDVEHVDTKLMDFDDFVSTASSRHSLVAASIGACARLGAIIFVAIIIWVFSPFQASDTDTDAAKETSVDAPYRWRLFTAIMCMTMYLLNYADRYNISVAIIEISEEQGYDKRMQGFIQSVVYLGFLPGTVLFGHLASPDIIGSFNSLLLACFCWSMATLLTPILGSRV